MQMASRYKQQFSTQQEQDTTSHGHMAEMDQTERIHRTQPLQNLNESSLRFRLIAVQERHMASLCVLGFLFFVVVLVGVCSVCAILWKLCSL